MREAMRFLHLLVKVKSQTGKDNFQCNTAFGQIHCITQISIELNRHVFPSQRNDHLSVAAVEEIYEKYTKRAKAEHPELFCHGPYTPHVMRHTTATHLIESGVPLAIVKISSDTHQYKQHKFIWIYPSRQLTVRWKSGTKMVFKE